MKNNITYSIVGIMSIVLIVGFISSRQNIVAPSVARDPVATAITSNTARAAVAPTDPEDIVPGTYPNLIKNGATATGLSVSSGRVENNVDREGKVTDDHLELLLKNTSAQDMSNFEVYYTITDLTTAKSEGYYKKLTGFVLKGGDSQSVHFDGKTGTSHFGVNKDGLYFTSKNKLRFDIQVSTPGFRVAHLQIFKDAGGAEVKD